MSAYCSSFNYLGLNSLTDHNLMVAHFEPDNGEMDAFLGMDPIYTESYDGTRRIDYGARFNSVATVKITMIKRDHSDFSELDVRKYLKWLTGARTNSYLDLVVGEEIKYSFLGRVTGMYQQKMDARTVGLSIEFSSVSPWAYSAVQTVERTPLTTMSFTIYNPTDDLHSFVYMKVTFQNGDGELLELTNKFVFNGEEVIETTRIDPVREKEIITINSNMMILSNNPKRVFGQDFNYVWPRLAPGENEFIVTGNGKLIFEYVYPIKIGDCAIETVQVFDPICDEDGSIIKDTLEWDRISDRPNTLAGYGITDGATVNYVNAQIAQITDVPVAWSKVTNKPTTRDGYKLSDVYTKTEVEGLFYKKQDTMTKDAINIAISNAVANLQVDEDELQDMLNSILT